MRTTLTLDPDTVKLLEEEVHRRREPFKKVVNDAIRRGLAPRGRRAAKPFRITPHRAELLPGLDPGALNRLADELDLASAVAKARRR